MGSPPRTAKKMKPNLRIGCGALRKRALAPQIGRVAYCVGDCLHAGIARVAELTLLGIEDEGKALIPIVRRRAKKWCVSLLPSNI